MLNKTTQFKSVTNLAMLNKQLNEITAQLNHGAEKKLN